MPGFDGTGPMGMGPQTGGGFGPCPQVNTPSGGMVYGLGRGGMPSGGGRGRGRGRGRGCGFGGGRGRGFAPAGSGWPGMAPTDPYGVSTLSADQEKSILQNQMALLSQQLDAIRVRLDEIETPAGEAGE